jgi:hypothetical protein
MIPFSALVLERMIFEIRYDLAFLYWDNSGKVIGDLLAKFPGFKPREVTPSVAAWDWLEESMTVTFSHLKADAAQDYPAKTEPFRSVCNELSSSVSRQLAVSTFSRIGVRLQFVLPAKDENSARDLMSLTHLVSADPKQYVAFGNKLMEQNISLRIEDEGGGATLRVSNSKRELSVTASKVFPVDTKRFHPNGLVLDLDIYTKKRVGTEIFSASDFIRKAEKSAEENLMTFAGLG